ncbi:hypothetical protein [Achromobacter insolitus]|uniref:hypothetical protein n=1 Tax=Achromobacter insolitus TaxID=217204 RepID=UPI0013AF19D4|nr:hypothetical protein [Achromobacter insolitus]
MPARRLPTASKARLLLLCSVLVYGASISVSHALYLSSEQAYWGFFEPSLDIAKIVAIIVALVMPTLAMPLKFNRASSVILLLLFLLVFVPAVVINLENHDESIDKYGYLMGAFSLGMTLLFASVRAFGAEPAAAPAYIPSKRIVSIFFLAWLFCCLMLVAIYHNSMSFQSLENVYDQREKGAATSLVVGYAQVYFAYLFSPFLFAYGLANKRKLAIVFAVCGFLITYMITAERTVFLLPIAMYLLYQIVRRGLMEARHVAVLTLGFSTLTLLIAFLWRFIGIFEKLGFYFLTRLIAYPGVFVAQYYDLFSRLGYTYWSHVSGVNKFVAAPSLLDFDRKWPMLGRILAERSFNVESNSNASLFATDGAAALGPIGIIVISILLAAWLILLDRATRDWNRRLVLPLLLPIGLALVNVSFFTMLTSFGGIIWLLFFYGTWITANQVGQARRA